jgi:anthranilate/para-aminobenzoate synthase component I
LSKSSLDLNILIRSAQIVEETMTLRFGGGLVWDSKPQSEYLETLAKAKGLFLSLEQGGAKIDLDS